MYTIYLIHANHVYRRVSKQQFIKIPLKISQPSLPKPMKKPTLLLANPSLIPISTNGDGNCAYNAMALSLCDLILSTQLPKTAVLQNLLSLLQKHAIISLLQLESFIIWLQAHSDLPERQQVIAPVLRELACQFIEKNYVANYQANYEALLCDAYARYIAGDLDDTFSVHKFIAEKFSELQGENLSTNEKLIHWWQATGKEKYFTNIKQVAINALDYARWASNVEIDALALAFNIQIQMQLGRGMQHLGAGSGLLRVDSAEHWPFYVTMA